MSIAKLSNGTLLKHGDGASPEVFTTVPEVTKLSGPDVKFDMLDVSSHDSASLFREYIPGFSDGDDITADIHWRPSNTVHIAVRTDNYAATLRNFKVVFPDTPSNTVTMAGYVQSLQPKADVGTAMMAAIKYKITGAPAWT